MPGLATGAALLGWLPYIWSVAAIFGFFAGLIAFAMVLFKFMKTTNHVKQVERLEEQYMDVLKSRRKFTGKIRDNLIRKIIS